MQVDKPVALHIFLQIIFFLLCAFFNVCTVGHMYVYIADIVVCESRLSALVIEAVSAVYIYSELSHTNSRG